MAPAAVDAGSITATARRGGGARRAVCRRAAARLQFAAIGLAVAGVPLVHTTRAQGATRASSATGWSPGRYCARRASSFSASGWRGHIGRCGSRSQQTLLPSCWPYAGPPRRASLQPAIGGARDVVAWHLVGAVRQRLLPVALVRRIAACRNLVGRPRHCGHAGRGAGDLCALFGRSPRPGAACRSRAGHRRQSCWAPQPFSSTSRIEAVGCRKSAPDRACGPRRRASIVGALRQ